MRNLVLAGVGLPGATLLGLAAWVAKVSHDTPGKDPHPAQLLYGVDEYWNGEYRPEDEEQRRIG